MKYIAHTEENREQLLSEHLQGTAKLAEMFAAKFGKGDWGYCSGLLHDIGKYSMEFQQKIQKNLNIKVDHSTAGAKVCMDLGGYYQFMSYCMVMYHVKKGHITR